MLDFFMQVQESAGGGGSGGGGGDAFNVDGDPPMTPTHLLLLPSGSSGNGFQIWDITTPSSPSKSAEYLVNSDTYSWGGTQYTMHRGCCVKNGTAYFHATLNDTLWSMDVSNPSVLGASQILNSLTGFSSNRTINAHPTKDILWVAGSNGDITTVDISNPSSMSVISTITGHFTSQVFDAAMSKDGEYFLQYGPGGDYYIYELSGSGAPVAVSLQSPNSWYSASYGDIVWAVSPVSGNNYALSVNYANNDVSVAEINSDGTVNDGYKRQSGSFDWPLGVYNAPYHANYSGDDLGVYVYERNDYAVSAFTVDPTTNTISYHGTIAHTLDISQTARSMDSFDQYIFVFSGLNRITTIEWQSLTTLSIVSVLDYAARGSVDCAKMCLYAP